MPSLQEVAAFWNAKSCGEVYASGESVRDQLRQQAATRYELEPYILDFAKFSEGTDRDVLEIGVGMGADHLEWAKAPPRSLVGVDLTERAVEYTRQRLQAEGFTPHVHRANAEQLPFPDNSFDIVYSWGVLHHSENPAKAIDEVFRVLRPGGTARLMIYHKFSIVGFLLWLRFGFLRGKSLSAIYSDNLESPGTHAYSLSEAKELLASFASVAICRKLSIGDLMEGAAGQRYQGRLLSVVRLFWPRWIIRLFPCFGLFMLIEAAKSS
jgi:SAM-dependent methyltransferase